MSGGELRRWQAMVCNCFAIGGWRYFPLNTKVDVDGCLWYPGDVLR